MTAKIAAAILAGGQARRLNGVAKGNLCINQKTIIEHLIGELERAGLKDIILVSENDAYQSYGLPMIKDNHHGIGPLAGIVAALEYCKDKFSAILFLPCDVPNVTVNEIKKLIKASKDKQIVYATTKIKHPLCAIVKSEALQCIDDLIKFDVRRVKEVWQRCNAQAVFFPNESAFVNVNNWSDVVS